MRKILSLVSIFSLIAGNRVHGELENSAARKAQETCGGAYFGYQYTISSPNYPANYSGDRDCVYELRGSRLAPCKQEYLLQFLDFDLRFSQNCSKDFLAIGARSVFCDRISGVRQFGGGDDGLRIVFHSAAGTGGRGFKILVTTLPCINSRNGTDGNELLTNDDKYKNKNVVAPEKLRPVYKTVTESTVGDKKYVTRSPGKNGDSKTESPRKSTFLFLPSAGFEKDFYKSKNISAENRKWPSTSSQKFQVPLEDSLPADTNTSTSTDAQGNDRFLKTNYDGPRTHFYPSTVNNFDGPYVSPTYGEPVSPATVNVIPGTNYGSPPLIDYPPINVASGNGNFLPNPNDCATPNYVSPAVVSVNSGNTYRTTLAENNCCNRVYSDRNFLLVSPGFPSVFYSSESYSCWYSIRKYSPQVCRLRLRFKFFNHGTEDRYCNYGYVEIDGRRICGCRTGQTITIDFPYIVKNINVRYVGYPRVKFNGFVIEVLQEICGGYYYNNLNRSKKDLESSGGNSSVTFEPIYQKKEIFSSERLEKGRRKRELGYTYVKPAVEFGVEEVSNTGTTTATGNLLWGNCQSRAFFDWIIVAKEVYLKGAQCSKSTGWNPGQNPGQNPGWNPGQNPGWNPGQNPGWNPGQNPSWNPGQNPGWNPGQNPGWNPGQNPGWNPGQNPGQNPGWNPGWNPGQNPGWNPGQNPGWNPGQNPGWNPGQNPGQNPGWNPGQNPGSPPNLPVPPPGGWNPSVPPGTCENINVLDGILSSPLYPSYYPNNVNICYRFSPAPGYCQLQLQFLDFDIENSIGCSKDYVTFTSMTGRYCGRYFLGKRVMLNFSRSSVIDFRFVSDSYGSGKGFSVGFTQIPCQGLVNI